MKHSLAFLSLLKRYLDEDVYPFHTPGHKGGRGALPDLKYLLDHALKIDVSLMDELDDIHNPNGALKTAQQEAALLYGADESFFAVNGTSGALHAMFLSSLGIGDKVLIPRNAHRSIASALVLSGAVPVYMMPEIDEKFNIALQVLPKEVSLKLQKEDFVKAVFLTSPSYYGIAADLLEVARLIQDKNILLFVDEAHGPHLGFNDKFPLSALQSGADASAQSTHKIIGAMTQCSILHVKGAKIDIEKVRQAMSLLTTTSPNQLLLASIDAACYQLALNSNNMLEKAFSLAEYMRKKISEIEGLKVLDIKEKALKNPLFDMTKVTVNVSALGMTGFEAADFLRKNKIAVELADYFNILYLVTYADDVLQIDRNIDVLKQMVAMKKDKKISFNSSVLPLCELVITPREAFYAKRKKVPLKQAVGLVAAEEITFYPPGIPLVLPGEKITKEVVDYCKEYELEKQQNKEQYISVVL